MTESKSGIIGFAVGDALGVPVEFKYRDSLKEHPVTDMQEYGTHNQPKGTWSDDTSMVLATIDGLIQDKYDFSKIMDNFILWMDYSWYTANEIVFDIGNTTRMALLNYKKLENKTIDNLSKCGLYDENSNGNGSLMRILPIVYLLPINNNYERWIYDNHIHHISDLSSMTHGNPISIMGCLIYAFFARLLMENKDKNKSFQILLNCKKYFKKLNVRKYLGIKCNSFYKYERIFNSKFLKISESKIASTGYVVYTLEACIWCFMTTDSYEEAVLKAVNLGHDTDTVAALTGALAGICYGYSSIPEIWLNNLAKKEFIIDLCNKFDSINSF